MQFATVSITKDMPRFWVIRGKRFPRGIGIRLPEYFPMGCKRHYIGLTIIRR